MNWYLFAGYSFTMTLILGYVVVLHGKLRRLGREMESIREELGEEHE